MTDPRRSGSSSDPTDTYPDPYPAYSDPAYAGSYPHDPSYAASAQPPPGVSATEPLSPYWTQTYGQAPATPPDEPPPGRTPRWLWVVAVVTVVVVLGLVAALVISNSWSREDTVVEPMPNLQPTTTAPRAPSPTRPPSPTPVPPPATTPPTTTTAPAATETVIYEVTGSGRAINITYVDTGRLLQTEFNVLLPWRREVTLPAPAADLASITVINIGRDITCSVSVDGAPVATRTGSGLTICSSR